MDTNIEQITTLAGIVAAEHAASVEAHEAVTEAKAELLTRVVEAVKPALRAVSDRIVAESYETMGRNGCNPVSRTEYHSERGLMLVNDYDRTKDETGNRGDLGGSRLYLLTDGRFARVDREGSFSHWQGEADEWKSTLGARTARQVAEAYGVDDVVKAIGDALTKARGTREKPTANARQRAERVRAVACLVK